MLLSVTADTNHETPTTTVAVPSAAVRANQSTVASNKTASKESGICED